MFISGSKRNPYSNMKFGEQNPPLGVYESNLNSISDNVRKKVEASVGNPLLANLKAKRGINAPFSSNARRFEEKKIEETEAFLGPGYYESKSTFEHGKASGNKPQGFQSNAQRFTEPTTGRTNELPGPGHYSSEDLNAWFKRSYNMIFTE